MIAPAIGPHDPSGGDDGRVPVAILPDRISDCP